MSARDVARRALDRVDKGAWATLTLDGELGRSGLEERDRRLVSELVYGVLRHRGRLDRALATHADLKRTPPRVITALRVAAYQLLFLDRVPGYAAVDDAVDAARALAGPKVAGFCNAVLRKLARTGEPPLPEEPTARISAEHSLPDWIVRELAAADADHLEQHAAAFARPAPLIARANTRRITRDALVSQLSRSGITSKPVDLSPSALELEGGEPLRDAGFSAGLWTVQDSGAQLVSIVADPRPGQRILDACAGVGGKSTHLAELTNDAAHIDAADQLPTKLTLAEQAATRLGLTSIRTRACDLLDPAAPLGTNYDLIVLDAPCSGLGVLRRHPDAKWRLTPADVPRLAGLQRQLLDAILPRLSPSGTLIYSVCTFTVAEGPAQVASLLSRTNLRLLSEHRTWPPNADAFYIARLQSKTA